MIQYIIFIITTLLVFLYGFFPVDVSVYKVKDVIKPPNKIDNIELSVQSWYKPYYNHTILIIIDALRSDFVTQNNMPFTTQLAKHNGCFMNVKVESPTVTLPRIKAITTGSVPQFIDVIFNLASTSILSDSLLHQAYEDNRKMIFYGDDTWLKLFPNKFLRSEGTTSFYVNDFTEVDVNVTKNVELELHKNDWNILILHYLGLDHIGHVLGPRSALVPPKLKEMDDVIKLIYNTLSKENPLILITGDHGMKDSGGHGGSTASETNVPLVIIGTNCLNDSILQTDISVNLAVLLGLNIPTTNTGILRQRFLNKIPLHDYLLALRYNTYTLLKKCDTCEDKYLLATNHHKLYLQNNDMYSAKIAIELYSNCSRIISEILLHSATSQNITLLIFTVLNLIYIFILFLRIIFSKSSQSIIVMLLNTLFILFYIFFNVFGFIFMLFIIFSVCREIFSLKKTHFKFHYSYILELFLLSVTILHPFSLLSTSLIEEEHQYWYFMFNTLLTLIILKNMRSQNLLLYTFISFILIRVLRTLNQTGDKWSFLSDLSDWLLDSTNFISYNIYFILSLLSIFYMCNNLSKHESSLVFINKIIILILIYINKMTHFNTTLLQKIIWLLIFVELTFCKSSFEIVWILISTLLMRPYNVILLSSCVILSKLVSHILKDTASLTLIHLCIGNTLFFMQGHSNSLASIDISSGYTALSSYQPIIVFGQVLFHTYSLPILTHLLVSKQKYVDVKKMWVIMFSYRLLLFIVFSILIIFQRHHIFIWTVFAPKLLIEVCHIVILSIEYLVYYLYKTVNKSFSY